MDPIEFSTELTCHFPAVVLTKFAVELDEVESPDPKTYIRQKQANAEVMINKCHVTTRIWN
jgi:hypothetical protein